VLYCIRAIAQAHFSLMHSQVTAVILLTFLCSLHMNSHTYLFLFLNFLFTPGYIVTVSAVIYIVSLYYVALAALAVTL
jgi:hypothetical protein